MFHDIPVHRSVRLPQLSVRRPKRKHIHHAIRCTHTYAYPASSLTLKQAIVLMILVIYVAQPFNSLPCRESLEYFLCGSNRQPSSAPLHYFTAVTMHAVVTMCACFCIINKINMDTIVGYFSTLSSTFVVLILSRWRIYFRSDSSWRHSLMHKLDQARFSEA